MAPNTEENKRFNKTTKKHLSVTGKKTLLKHKAYLSVTKNMYFCDLKSVLLEYITHKKVFFFPVTERRFLGVFDNTLVPC